MAKIIKLKSTNIGEVGPEDDIYPVTRSEAVYDVYDGKTSSLRDVIFKIIDENSKPEFNLKLIANGGGYADIADDGWVEYSDDFDVSYNVNSSIKINKFDSSCNTDLTAETGFTVECFYGENKYPILKDLNTTIDGTIINTPIQNLIPARNIPIEIKYTYNEYDNLNLGHEIETRSTHLNIGTATYFGWGDTNANLANVIALNKQFLKPGSTTITLQGSDNGGYKHIYIAVPNYLTITKVIQPDGMNMELALETPVNAGNLTIKDYSFPYKLYKSKAMIDSNNNKRIQIFLN